MKTILLSLLLIPCLMIPCVSCGNDDGTLLKQVSHSEFALKAIKFINEPSNCSKAIISGTYEDYRSKEITPINTTGSVDNTTKEIFLDTNNYPNKIDLYLKMVIYQFHLYLNVCFEQERYTYFISDYKCGYEYYNEYGTNKIYWNSYGTLDSIDMSYFDPESLGQMENIIKLNISYE